MLEQATQDTMRKWVRNKNNGLSNILLEWTFSLAGKMAHHSAWVQFWAPGSHCCGQRNTAVKAHWRHRAPATQMGGLNWASGSWARSCMQLDNEPAEGEPEDQYKIFILQKDMKTNQGSNNTNNNLMIFYYLNHYYHRETSM